MSFAGSGRAHFESPDGEVDGAVQVRVDPPSRAWMQLQAKSLFGLVGDRLVVSLPGDGFVLMYRQRGDQLERLRFEASPVAPFTLGGGVPGLLQLLAGRLPWPDGRAPVDLASRAAVRVDGDAVEYRLRGAPGPRDGEYLLRFAAGRLQRFEWWDDAGLRLRAEYDRFVPLGESWYPSRVRVVAPAERLRAELRLQRLEPRSSFGRHDFEVGATLRMGARMDGT